MHLVRLARLRVIVGVHRPRECQPPRDVQPRDEVRLGAVEVDRPGIDADERRGGVHLLQHLVVAGLVQQEIAVATGGADAHPARRVLFADIVPAPLAGLERPLLHQLVHDAAQPRPKERLVLGSEGILVGGARQVPPQHIGVARVDQRLLVGPGKERLRMPHQVLVQRVVLTDEHGKRRPVSPPRPAGLLPGAGDTARIADEDGGVQLAHVDAQLQGVGRGDGQQLAGEQASLDLTPFLGGIAAAVRSDALREVGALSQGVAGVEEDQLRHLARPGKGDVAQRLLDHFGEQPRRLGVDAGPPTAGGVEHRGVPQHEPARAPRRAVIVHHRRRLADELRGVGAGVADGSRRQDEPRIGAVQRADPPQPAQHVRQVRAKDPAVDVRLVHHHVAQVPEKGRPRLVVRQDPHVQHIGVREDDGGRAPHPGATPLRGIAVVRHDAGAAQRGGQPLEHAQLILSQRLGGVEVQGASEGIGHQRLEHRHVVAQRLAAGRAGGYDDVPAVAGRINRPGLVRVEPLDALRRQHLPQARRQRTFQVRPDRRARRNALYVGDLLEIIGQRPQVLDKGVNVHDGPTEMSCWEPDGTRAAPILRPGRPVGKRPWPRL